MIIGNLGSDPEIRTVSSGTKVANFSVATSRSWTDRNGQQQEKTEWHRIVMWGSSPERDGLAGVAERFLKKGDRVYIEGEIEYRQYEATDGSGTRYVTEIRARDMIMLSGREGGAGEGDYGRSEQPARGGARSGGAARESGRGGRDYDDFRAPPVADEDDLPF
jgi:single-strand DNA-binding protein